jgi:phosphoenolpyruvate carboxykinase (ATP)
MDDRIEYAEIAEADSTPVSDSTVGGYGDSPRNGGAGSIYRNLSAADLCEQVVRRGEGLFSDQGALVVNTGLHTGRSADDKFIVREPGSEQDVWWGKVNRPFPPEKFNSLLSRMKRYMLGRDIFIQDCAAGADPRYQIRVRVITELAWHSLFARHLFIRNEMSELAFQSPDFTVIDLPGVKADPGRDATRSETFILIDFSQRLVLIGGTSYAGEIKKSVFTVLNYLLPRRMVMSMHCSANIGSAGDTAIFFGLSGTGKTTLSADPSRRLIGDDEHGWSDHGIFNFEGGCYAKVIRLNPDAEPEIYATTRRFGTVLENVAIDDTTRVLDLNSDAVTENTRAAYPLSYIPNSIPSGMGGHPRNIIMLTADAFGVLPPVARLTPEQAMYHFISGYTAKLAGTERGIGKEPQATFSTCFGAPFMVLHPSVYAGLLRDCITAHNVDCWLVNTGWTGGPYGVGRRMEIHFTRAIINAVLNGSLAPIPASPDPIFHLPIPAACPGVPSELLLPRNTWKNKLSYDTKARELAHRFSLNYEQYSGVGPQQTQ